MADFGDGADRAGAPVGGVPVAGAEFLGDFFEFGLSGKLGMRRLVNARGGRVLFICYDPARGAMSRPVFTALVDLCLMEALGRVSATAT